MKLFDLLMAVDPTTIISIQFSKDDTEAFCGLKEAGDYTVADTKPFKVKTFYPEKYPAVYCTGITVIVEEVA